MNVMKNTVYLVCYFMEYSVNVRWVKLVDSVVTFLVSLLIFFPLVLSNIYKKGTEISNHILYLPGYFCSPINIVKLFFWDAVHWRKFGSLRSCYYALLGKSGKALGLMLIIPN